MSFPLNLWDINLLVAVISIILLSTSEFISISHGKINMLIDKKKLRKAAIATSIFFLITVAVRIAAIIFQL
jgi:hypothetical protein